MVVLKINNILQVPRIWFALKIYNSVKSEWAKVRVLHILHDAKQNQETENSWSLNYLESVAYNG